MKKITTRIVTVFLVLATALTPLVLPATSVSAVNPYKACGKSSSTVCAAQNDEAAPLIKSVINILLYILGAIAVIMIIVGGIRYSLSNGNATELTGAKNSILYAVIGLVVAMLAWAIVNFVIGMF